MSEKSWQDLWREIGMDTISRLGQKYQSYENFPYLITLSEDQISWWHKNMKKRFDLYKEAEEGWQQKEAMYLFCEYAIEVMDEMEELIKTFDEKGEKIGEEE